MDPSPTPSRPEEDAPEEFGEPPAQPGPDPDPGFYQRALRRMPLWIALVTVAALPFVWRHGGALWAASFLAGAIGGYWNYIAICRVADRLVRTVEQDVGASPPGGRFLLRLLFIGVALFVIIRFTRIDLVAAFIGFFAPGAAVVVEIVYELISYATTGKRESRQI